MEKYYDNVTVIIDYLEMNKYCSTTIQANQRCSVSLKSFSPTKVLIIHQKSQMNGMRLKFRQSARRTENPQELHLRGFRMYMKPVV